MKASKKYKIISYVMIYIVFFMMGLYLDASILLIILFSTSLNAILFFTSFLLEKGIADRNALIAIKSLMYLYVASHTFIFSVVAIDNILLTNKIIGIAIGGASIICFLIAISRTGSSR